MARSVPSFSASCGHRSDLSQIRAEAEGQQGFFCPPKLNPTTSSSSEKRERELPSLLDKPLEELTEEDIQQLTREDCRRYLKERGMRRPSWNKSQAIQQVLSLKGLFDSKSDEDGVVALQMPCREPNSTECERIKLPGQTKIWCSSHVLPSQNSEPGCIDLVARTNHVGTDRFVDQPSFIRFPPAPQGTMASMASKQKAEQYVGSHLGMQSQHVPSLCVNTSKAIKEQPTAQLTIFYAGVVNVYDDIPADKANAIMLLAESVNPWSSMDATASQTSAGCATSNAVTTYNTSRVSLLPPSLSFLVRDKEAPVITSQPEQQPSRKALVQRFLEKRKERVRLKGPYTTQKLVAAASSLSLPQNKLLEELPTIAILPKRCPLLGEGGQTPAQSSGSETSSSPTKPPPTPRQNSSNEQQILTRDGVHIDDAQENMSDDDIELPSSPSEDNSS